MFMYIFYAKYCLIFNSYPRKMDGKYPSVMYIYAMAKEVKRKKEKFEY